MGRRLFTLIALLLTACIGIRVGPIDVVPGIPVVVAVAQQIRTNLGRVRSEIPVRRGRLPSVPCGSAKCYAVDDVQAVVAEIRRKVNAAIPDAALASRLTLDAEIAQAAAQLAARRIAPEIVLIRNPPDAKPPAVPESAVDAVFARMLERIDKYLAHPVLNPTIRVRSDPAGATFTMQIGENSRTQCRTRTDNEIQSVWRGRYNASAHKPGYRDVLPFVIDLVNDDRTKVRCSLVALTAPPSEESNCRLEN
jgi:hypothetical protein